MEKQEEKQIPLDDLGICSKAPPEEIFEKSNENPDNIQLEYVKSCPTDPDPASLESDSTSPIADITEDIAPHVLDIPTEPILSKTLPKPNKKRRRIVTLSGEYGESSDSDEDPRNLDMPPSPSAPDLSNDPSLHGKSSSDESSLPKITAESIEALAKHDRPGPKSKKASTRLLKEFQARALLESAIVIPAAIDTRKRKIRILDSDGEDDVNDVNDIGLKAEDNLLIVSTSVAVANDELHATACPIELSSVGNDDLAAADECDEPIDGMCMALDINVGHRNDADDAEQSGLDDQNGENSDNGLQSDRSAEESSRNGGHRDSGNSSDGSEHPNTVKDTLVRDSSPEKLDSSDDDYVPNEVYFGTPDPKNALKISARGRGSGRARGRPPSHSTMLRRQAEELEPPKPKQRGRPRGSGRRGRPPTRPRFVDDRSFSSGSSSTQTSTSEAEPEEQNIKPTASPSSTKSNATVNSPGCMNKITASIETKSRFPDKSSKIPESIYFGDVDVPLHVLHSYDNTSGESEHETSIFTPQHFRPRGGLSQSHTSRGRGRGRGRPPGSSATARAIQSTPSKRGRKPGSTSAERFLKHMKKCYKAAGLKRPRFKEGSRSAQSRAEKILDLLHEHGLVGEPTISACRQLKKEIVTNEEISELDPNLILQSEGRTRRQSARAATHRKYTYDDPDQPVVAAPKFTPIIDSESESD